MSESPIAGIELFHIALPRRREHTWAGLQEPIGGYLVLKMTDGNGRAGWSEAPALKDWGGDFGRYYVMTGLPAAYFCIKAFSETGQAFRPLDDKDDLYLSSRIG